MQCDDRRKESSMTGIVDIAMAGSLCKKGEWHPLLDQYGMVIVDEYDIIGQVRRRPILKAS